MGEGIRHSHPHFLIKSFSPSILIIDDDPSIAGEMAGYLRQDGYAVETIGSAEEALQAFIHKTYHLVLIDAFLPGRSALDFILLLKDACPQCIVVLLIGPAPLQAPADVLELSTIPCLSKPVAPYVLRKRVHDLLKKGGADPNSRLLSLDKNQGILWEGIRTRSTSMKEILDHIRMIASVDTAVMIQGEQGTGKELIARAIHNQSKRQNGPFLSFRTKTIAKDRLIYDLFGNDERNTRFEGPFRGKIGMALGGTLFLDELFHLDERSLLRFLRLAEPKQTTLAFKHFRSSNVRMIFATYHTLPGQQKTKSPHFEFIERINPLRIHLPPLRERPEDITPLAYDFLSHFSIYHRKLLGIIPSETRKLLEQYSWPGNIKELRQVIEQAVLFSKGPVLDPELLPYRIYHSVSGGKIIPIPLGWSLEKAEREIIWKTLEAHQKNKHVTSELLGISRRSLYNKLEGYFRQKNKGDDF